MKIKQLGDVPSRRRGKPLTTEEKWLVVRVFKKCNEERQGDQYVETKDAYSRTSHYTGVGHRQVVEIIRYFKEMGKVPPSSLAGNRTVHQANIPVLAEEYIREFIFNRHLAGEACNANHIRDHLHDVLKRDIAKRTIRNQLQRMGFTYSRSKKKPRSLREKPYIRQQRHAYLHNIRYLREKGYQPVYLDESYLHHYHGNQFSWFNDSAGDYLERPAGKGRRWCFIHAMLKNGLISNAYHIFEAKKITGDYHHMFNAHHFQEWWKQQLLPNIPMRCVIVLDRATFHLVPEGQIIPFTMRKAELQAWLSEKNILWEDHWLKSRLLEEVNNHIDKKPLVQKIAEEQGHKVLFLPVHHPELNPIELIWAIVKNECGRLLRQGVKFMEVRKHLEDAFDKITATTCQQLFDKIQQIEKKYWITDLDIDDIEDGEIDDNYEIYSSLNVDQLSCE